MHNEFLTTVFCKPEAIRSVLDWVYRSTTMQGGEPGCSRSRNKSSNGSHYGYTTFLPAFRFTMCGRLICRERVPGSRWNEFLKTTNSRCLRPSFVVSALLRIRLAVGRIFGWDREPATPAWQSFAARMTPEDRVKSLAPAGTHREGSHAGGGNDYRS
jgi:hypothetical protein